MKGIRLPARQAGDGAFIRLVLSGRADRWVEVAKHWGRVRV